MLELVSITNTRGVWPAEFAALVATCEADPDDRLPFGLVADWCDEHNEPELGRAWRWLHKRPWDDDKRTGVRVLCKREYGTYPDWQMTPLPRSLILEKVGITATLAELVAVLADRLAEVERETQA